MRSEDAIAEEKVFDLLDMGMDLADKENTSPPLFEFCNCYKVATLTQTILNPVNVSSLKDRYDLIRGMLCVDPSQRLTADGVLAHTWMDELSEPGQEQYGQDGVGCEGLESGGCSFSIEYVSREQDYSFSMGQLEESIDNDCRSSFSSFLPADNNNVALPTSGFGGEQLESTLPSMPSFTFFSPSPATTQNNNTHETDEKLRDSSPKRLLPSPDSCSQPEKREEEGESQIEAAGKTETRRERGNWSRISGLHSKRNRTIGIGELDQLVVDVAVTESIIRWASCTHIPTAPSLTLSLVC
ncbi:hypothetical protein HID58_083568 [Brassica napus]|uniref:Protein kinase domain-containing protein n=1 Tax=Brassica napus TaxID=3708 RepID=A0ABQ7YDW8_BRANA|nr:hypothetical protein HID58_083568 [Brassica napus]